MSSYDRLRTATEAGILPADSVRAALGTVGISSADTFIAAEAPETPIATTDAQESLARTFAIAGDLCAAVLSLRRATLPTAGMFDRESYLELFDELQDQELQPEFVLSPQLTRPQTRDLFTALSELNLSPLKQCEQPDFEYSDGLHINRGISNDLWDIIARRYPTGQQFVQLPNGARPDINWSLSILPTRPQLFHRNKSWWTLHKQRIALPTITQLVSLHAQNLYDKRSTIDSDGDIAVAATTENAKHMPGIGFFYNTVHIKWTPKQPPILTGKHNRGTRPIAYPGSLNPLTHDGVS